MAVVLTAGLTTSAAAAPGSPGPRVRTVGSADPTSQLPVNHDYLIARTGLATSAHIGRAKIDLRVPKFTGLAYSFIDDLFPRLPNFKFLVPESLGPRHPKPQCRYTINSLPALLVAVDISRSDPHAPPRYRSVGRFPATPVTFLAFGSIPVTATLHIRQPIKKDGHVEPFVVNSYFGPSAIFRDDPTGESGSCDPAWESTFVRADGNENDPVVVTGRVLATITDVRVDGHPLPVGPECRAATPLDIHLDGQDVGHNGDYGDVTSGGVLRQQLDRLPSTPSSQAPWFPGSRNLTIPPFVGCRGAAGDDISRLVTALVSGSENTLAVSQSTITPITPFDPNTAPVCTTPDCFRDYAQPGTPGK